MGGLGGRDEIAGLSVSDLTNDQMAVTRTRAENPEWITVHQAVTATFDALLYESVAGGRGARQEQCSDRQLYHPWHDVPPPVDV
jgi:hypothetical protein